MTPMKKKIISILCAALMLTSLASCGKEEEKPSEYYSATFFAMDTEVTVKLSRSAGADENGKVTYHDDSHLSQIVKECANIAAKTEAKLSRTIADSAVSELNKETDYFLGTDPEVLMLIKTAEKYSKLSDGAFDVTVGSVTELWNVTSDSAAVPSDESIAEAMSHVGYEKLVTDGVTLKKTDRKTKIDLGAIGKGYALGKIMEYLKTTDVSYGLVSFGGNVGTFGTKPNGAKYKVGVTDAADTSRVIGYVYIGEGFVSVSGDYERFFVEDGKAYGHIFDPSTGRPAESDVVSVAVIMNDAAGADALSTALFVMGSDGVTELYGKSASVPDFEAVVQLKDGTVLLTDGLKGEGGFEKYVEPESAAE